MAGWCGNWEALSISLYFIGLWTAMLFEYRAAAHSNKTHREIPD